jgi:hypothetical protein
VCFEHEDDRGSSIPENGVERSVVTLTGTLSPFVGDSWLVNLSVAFETPHRSAKVLLGEELPRKQLLPDVKVFLHPARMELPGTSHTVPAATEQNPIRVMSLLVPFGPAELSDEGHLQIWEGRILPPGYSSIIARSGRDLNSIRRSIHVPPHKCLSATFKL